MSRQNGRPRSGVKLPFALQKELGIEPTNHVGRGGRGSYGSVRDRKEQRKADRLERRHQSTRPKTDARRRKSDDETFEDDVHVAAAEPAPRPTISKRQPATKETVEKDRHTPRSILKRPRQPSPSPSETSSFGGSRSSSPGLVLDANSHAFRERAAQDDAEITALERNLGLKKGKLPKSFLDDGLDDILGGLEEEEDRGVKRKGDGEDWLERKRRKAAVEAEHDSDEDGSAIDDEGVEDDSDDDLENAEDESFEHFDSTDEEGDEKEEEEEVHQLPAKKARENPYVAPVAPNASTAKYVPPSLRKVSSSDGQSLERLRRQLQGHLNKLSEANLISILGEIEKVYQSNPRQDVTTVLIDLLLSLFTSKSTLQNTFVILHASFAAAVYKVVGVDFGADLVSQLVDRFDQYHDDSATGKESLNLISLLSNLYTFNVIGGAIIFEYIQMLLERLSENNTELLLRLIRDCGPQLRHDDPSSLKAIVQLVQKEAARMNASDEKMSVRTKFMIETITDLKNNKMRAATGNAGLSSEHITQMRKALGSLNSRTLKASEPLRITRDDIRNSDKKGKWWLVGASWKGNERVEAEVEAPIEVAVQAEQVLHDDSIDLVALSRQYGMNTTVRRSIFVALLSAVDYQDAHLRLLKLRLKRAQEQEIPKVLLRCAAGEKPYNQYYTLVARKLCLDKKMRKAFQFALWSFFRRLGENADLEEDDEDRNDEGEEVEMGEMANLARLYAHLILEGAETLGVLKVLDLALLKERTTMFVELLLIMVITEAQSATAKANTLVKVFERLAETPQVIQRLQFFIKNNVRRSDLVAKSDREAVKRGCKVALETLRRLSAVEDGLEE